MCSGERGVVVSRNEVTKKASELPSFQVDEQGLPTQDAIRAYEEDGVVCLRGAFSKATKTEWERMRDSTVRGG